jgi:pyruvate formate lyase activating enzyme
LKLKRTQILRIPVIPTVNDDVDNIKATADFTQMNAKSAVAALSFGAPGEEKYELLGYPTI